MSFPSQAPLRGNFVLLRADTLRLLLPQGEVGAAEYLQTRPQPTDVPGLLRGEGDRPVAALSARMTLLPHCPPQRFVLARLADAGDAGEAGEGIGWCWDELQVLIDVELQPRPLPPVLLTPHTPVEQYVEHEGELAFLCSARRLAGFALGAGAAA